MRTSTPAGVHLIGLYVSVCTLPAAILLAVRMTSPLWWLLPIAVAALIGSRLRMLREARRQHAGDAGRPDDAALTPAARLRTGR
jgi:hypothetical protein